MALERFWWGPGNLLICTFVPFKSKLTLDSRSSRESRIENRESSLEWRLDSRLLRLHSRFSIPSRFIKPERLLFIVSSNPLSTLDTRLL